MTSHIEEEHKKPSMLLGPLSSSTSSDSSDVAYESNGRSPSSTTVATEGPLTKFLLLAVIACTIGSSFQFGYHIGNVNAPAELIKQWFNESYIAIDSANSILNDSIIDSHVHSANDIANDIITISYDGDNQPKQDPFHQIYSKREKINDLLLASTDIIPKQNITDTAATAILNASVIAHAGMNNDTLDMYWATAVSSFGVSGMVGGLLGGQMADFFGRKRAIILNNILLLAGAAFLTLAKYSGIFYLFIVGRLIIGVNCGLNTGLAPIYLTEISPSNLRGSLGSAHQLFITIGILIAQILSLPFIFGTETLWPLIFGFTIVPAVIQLLLMPFSPESPKYSLINRGDIAEAEASLRRLRNRHDVSVEMAVYNDEAEASRATSSVSIRNMFSGDYRWPMIIAIIMMFAQQLTGINVVMFYSTIIFESAGLTGSAPIYATIAMATINVLMTFVSVYLVDHPRFGRRTLHLGGLCGMFLSTLLLTLSFSLKGVSQLFSYASVVFVLLYVITYASGPGSIPWFFVSEVFASNARGSASSIATVFNWGSTVFVSLSFLPLQRLIGDLCFLVFAFIQLIVIVFLWFVMPETKGKSVEQIAAEMNKKFVLNCCGIILG